MAAKPTPERKSRSGSYVPNDLRNDVRVEVRCSPDIAARARMVAKQYGRTLAEILDAGAMAIRNAPTRTTTQAAQDAADERGDRAYERMVEDDIRGR